MFMYFPTNYVWSMAVVASLNNGGYIDEIDRACKPVLIASQNGDDAGTEELYASWSAVVDRLVAKARDDEARGRRIGAGRPTTGPRSTPRRPSACSRPSGRGATPPTSGRSTCCSSTSS
ncbi:hypothetical protein [Naasia aerilata]|uniref:Uncharacterized protein n=1 Tax=Naasia aerilata TaxID=1162966 RepID=A0ABM8G7U5_9MICO|nr:hypothetical protein [Naasia aerilata]BDZ44249.1 hypothetical protein GCM10025866_01580 [Naasia aerilata]